MKTSEPIPAASSPGSSTSGSIGPPSPAASMISTAPITGEPKIDETAAKLPAAAISPSTCCGRVLPARAASRGCRAPSRARSAAPPGRARARARASRSRRGARPGSSIGSVGAPPVLSPSAGTCPPCPGSRSIANAVSEPGEREPGQRPPGGHRVVAEVVRQVLVDPDLDHVHELEEPPRGRRDDAGRSATRARAARGTACCGSATRGSTGRGSGPVTSRQP